MMDEYSQQYFRGMNQTVSPKSVKSAVAIFIQAMGSCVQEKVQTGEKHTKLGFKWRLFIKMGVI